MDLRKYCVDIGKVLYYVFGMTHTFHPVNHSIIYFVIDTVILLILLYSFRSLKWIMYCVFFAYARYNLANAFFEKNFIINGNTYCDPN